MSPLWLCAVAVAADWLVPGSAQLPGPGQVVLALPTAQSSVGLGAHSALVLVPFEMRVGGPRLGVEAGMEAGDWQLAVLPSLGVKVQGTQGLGELGLSAGRGVGAGRIDLSLSPSLRVDLQHRLGTEDSRQFQQGRAHLPVSVAYTHLWTRHALRLRGTWMLYDEGRLSTFGTLGVDGMRRWEHLQVSVGVHGLVGTPSEQLFLGRYEHTLVAAYPKLGLWWVG